MVRCPVCDSEKDYSAIGNHWARACKFPQPSPDEQSVFVGLYLAGGNIEWSGTHPRMRKRSRSQPAMEWVDDAMGVWSSSLVRERDVTTNDEYLRDDQTARARTVWRWTSVACPWLDHLADARVEDLQERIDHRALRVLVSFKGHQVDGNIRISHGEPTALAAALADLGFEGTAQERDGRSGQVTLDRASSRVLFEQLEPPLPGIGEKFDVERVLEDQPTPRWQQPDVLAELCEDHSYMMLLEELDCSDATLSKWLDRFDLDPAAEYPKLEDAEWLRQEYHDKRKSQPEIADDLGCARQTVSKWMRKHEIETR